MYFSGMTFVFLFRTYASNPGFMPKWLKVANASADNPPTKLLRIYNFRTWMASQIFPMARLATADPSGDSDTTTAGSETERSSFDQ